MRELVSSLFTEIFHSHERSLRFTVAIREHSNGLCKLLFAISFPKRLLAQLTVCRDSRYVSFATHSQKYLMKLNVMACARKARTMSIASRIGPLCTITDGIVNHRFQVLSMSLYLSRLTAKPTAVNERFDLGSELERFQSAFKAQRSFCRFQKFIFSESPEQALGAEDALTELQLSRL